jgi:molecular chaperone DnaK (HSP70)
LRGERQAVARVERTTGCALGVEVDGGRTVILIRRGQTIPAAGRMIFTTVADGQPAVEIPVVQMSGFPPRALTIGRFLLAGFPVGERGSARIEVALAVDGRGVLRARARDLGSGACQEVTFARSPRVTPSGRALARAS